MSSKPIVLVTLQKKGIRECTKYLKFPRDIADLLDEFVGYSPSKSAWSRAYKIGQQIKVGYSRWLVDRKLYRWEVTGRRYTENDCKRLIWSWKGANHPIFKGNVIDAHLNGYLVDPQHFEELLYYLKDPDFTW